MTVEVVRPGTMTTVQDWPGRLGYWHVGVPPSGPMDDRSFRHGNLALGNPEGAPGLECMLEGPTLQFTEPTTVCVTGAAVAVPMWEPVEFPAGSTLTLGKISGPGLRTYILFAGGLDVEPYLASAATFTLGRFGRALKHKDVLRCAASAQEPRKPVPIQ